MSLLHLLANTSAMDWVSLATASAMVLASTASLAAFQSRLRSLLASEVVASPSLFLSLFPIMMVGVSVQSGRVSNYQCSLSYLIQHCCAGQFCWNLALPLKSHFKSIKNKLSFYVSNMLWQMVSEEV